MIDPAILACDTIMATKPKKAAIAYISKTVCRCVKPIPNKQ